MIAQYTGLDAGLSKTLVERRETLRRRLTVAAVCAFAFAPLAGWVACAAWFAAYAALLSADRRWLVTPSRDAALALLSMESLLLGVLGVVAALHGGGWGAAAGAMLLTAALLESANLRKRSWPAFVSTAAPLAAQLVVLVALAWRGAGAAATLALGAAAGVAALAAVRLWKGAAEGLARQRRARVEADRRRLEAESAAGAASVFAATAGHELRAPLNAILAAAEAIERAPQADPALRGQAASIGDSGRTMRMLLDDLLDLAKLGSGRMRMERVDFDLRELVEDTLALWSAQAERRGLALRLEGGERLPQAVSGDPMRLRQVLNNLVSNAVKFTETGGVTIRATTARLTDEERRGDDPADWLVRLSVEDTGPGLSPAELARLFTPVSAADAGAGRAQDGGGLGLGLSRELARLMGGDLFAASPEGGGAVFTLEVALADARAAATTPQQDLRALVADDQETGRRALALMLEPYGVQVTAASSAEAALELLARQPFDVVLMDVSTPQMGGWEVCRRLRAAPGPNRATPVIGCTASAGDQDWEACRRAGMTGMVAKPIEPSALHAAIGAALRAVQAQTAAA